MAGWQTTARLPVAVAKSPGAMVFVAWTVNEVVAPGVDPVVVMVSVAVFNASPVAKLTVVGLNDAVAPVGKPVALKLALKEPVPTSRFTVIGYVALLPDVTGI